MIHKTTKAVLIAVEECWDGTLPPAVADARAAWRRAGWPDVLKNRAGYPDGRKEEEDSRLTDEEAIKYVRGYLGAPKGSQHDRRMRRVLELAERTRAAECELDDVEQLLEEENEELESVRPGLEEAAADEPVSVWCWRVGGLVDVVPGDKCPECGAVHRKVEPSPRERCGEEPTTVDWGAVWRAAKDALPAALRDEHGPCAGEWVADGIQQAIVTYHRQVTGDTEGQS